MHRWTPEELGREHAELVVYASRAADQIPFDIRVRAMDWMVQRCLPANHPMTEAQWQSSRAKLIDKLGRIEAGETIEPEQPLATAGATPDSIFDAFVEGLEAECRARRVARD